MLRNRAQIVDENVVETLAEEVQQFGYPLNTRADLDPLMERIVVDVGPNGELEFSAQTAAEKEPA